MVYLLVHQDDYNILRAILMPDKHLRIDTKKILLLRTLIYNFTLFSNRHLVEHKNDEFTSSTKKMASCIERAKKEN